MNDVDLCKALDPSSLPPQWGALTADPDPSVKLGDRGCDIGNPKTALALSLSLYLGPGRGIASVSSTVGGSVIDSAIDGRPVKIYDDGASSGTCGVIFDFGPDQSIAVAASPPIDKSIGACDIATTAATAMAPNLPQS